VGGPVEAKHDIGLQPMRNIALAKARIGRKAWDSGCEKQMIASHFNEILIERRRQRGFL
jgi:hypothetical protein